MKCKEIQRLINLYFDRKLTDTEKKIIHGHIKLCDECSAMFNAEKIAVQFLNQASMKKAPIGFTDQVMESIGKQSHQKKLQITDQHAIAILSRSLIAAGVVFCFLDVSVLYEKLTLLLTINLHSKIDWMQQIFDIFSFFK